MSTPSTLPPRTSILSNAGTYSESLAEENITFEEFLAKRIKKTAELSDMVKENPLKPVGEFLLFSLASMSKWTHDLRIYTYNRQATVLRAMVCTGFVVFLCSVLRMVRTHHLHGGPHHVVDGALPGGNIMLNPLRDTHHRIPPVYNPETDRTHRFRQYVEDVGIWCMMTDLAPHQQAAAIISRFQGHAREIVLLLPAHEVAAGRLKQDGTYVDPITNLMEKLAQRFAPFEDEERNEAMLKVWNFTRRPHEDIDSLLSRFEEL